MSMAMKRVVAFGIPGVAGVPSAVRAAIRGLSAALVSNAVALILLSLLPAEAAQLPEPAPFAQAVPALSSKCLPVEAATIQLGSAIAELGGRGLALTSGMQQRFADAWRGELELQQVVISTTLVWLRKDVLVAEFDDKGCLLTLTAMSLEQFIHIIHVAASESAGRVIPSRPSPRGLSLI